MNCPNTGRCFAGVLDLRDRKKKIVLHTKLRATTKITDRCADVVLRYYYGRYRDLNKKFCEIPLLIHKYLLYYYVTRARLPSQGDNCFNMHTVHKR